MAKIQYVQYPAEVLKSVSMCASLLDTVSLTAVTKKQIKYSYLKQL